MWNSESSYVKSIYFPIYFFIYTDDTLTKVLSENILRIKCIIAKIFRNINLYMFTNSWSLLYNAMYKYIHILYQRMPKINKENKENKIKTSFTLHNKEIPKIKYQICAQTSDWNFMLTIHWSLWLFFWI